MTSGHQPFGRVLRDLLITKDVTTRNGNPDWAGFCQQLDGISYETLRKAVTGDRQPHLALMESVSDALSVPRTTFVEFGYSWLSGHSIRAKSDLKPLWRSEKWSAFAENSLAR